MDRDRGPAEGGLTDLAGLMADHVVRLDGGLSTALEEHGHLLTDSLWPARLLLWPITLYFFLRRGPERRASRDYLARVLPHPPGAFDVLRHLHGEPVLAAPPGRAYRVRKFVRRHRGGVDQPLDTLTNILGRERVGRTEQPWRHARPVLCRTRHQGLRGQQCRSDP